MNFMATTIEKQARELVSKQTELEKALEKVCESEQEAILAKVETKNNAEAALAYQHQLQRAKLQDKQFEQKFAEARDKLADSEISHHKLRKLNEGLRLGE